jgi:hypothetical protein
MQGARLLLLLLLLLLCRIDGLLIVADRVQSNFGVSASRSETLSSVGCTWRAVYEDSAVLEKRNQIANRTSRSYIHAQAYFGSLQADNQNPLGAGLLMPLIMRFCFRFWVHALTSPARFLTN